MENNDIPRVQKVTSLSEDIGHVHTLLPLKSRKKVNIASLFKKNDNSSKFKSMMDNKAASVEF
jgi:hypothetical protein